MPVNKGSGGVKGAVLSLIMIVVISAVGVGWMRNNNITSVSDGYAFFKALSDHNFDCTGQGQLQWNCEGILKGIAEKNLGASDVNLPSAPGSENGDVTQDNSSNGLIGPTGEIPSKIDAEQQLEGIEVKDEQEVDYVRSEWKHWIATPENPKCNAREAVLIRDGENVKTNDECRSVSGTWVDFYDTENKITDSSKVDIDHVIALGYAASHGGNDWPTEKKQQFANDQSQLLAVSATENRSKSDSGPAEYMPPNKDFHCDFSKIWTQTATKYELFISQDDKDALTKGLSKCEA